MIQLKENSKETDLQLKLLELEETLAQIQKELQRESDYNDHLEGLIKEASAKKSATIIIKSATKIEFIQVNDIVCCNADEGYTDVQLIDGRTITATKPLTTFENILQEHSFFKISKSHLINTGHILTFYKDRNQILLQGDILLDVSRRRRVEFLKTL